jgi:hypothetical protein
MNTNRKPVNEIVSEIQNHLESSIKSWKEIAKLFYIAREQYFLEGSENQAYKRILSSTSFHPKTALKLAIVGKALAENDQKLEHPMFEQVQSWTVLYDALTMNDEQIDQLAAEMKVKESKEQPAVPSRAVIKRIKDGPTTSDDYVSVFNIRVDANAIKTGRFTDQSYGEMLDLIERIQSLAYVRIDKTNAYSNRNEAWVTAYNEKIQEIVTKQRATCLSALSKALDEDDDFDVNFWNELSKVDPDGFNDQVRSCCPDLKLLSSAEIAEEARRFLDERFQKVSVNEPYAHANSTISAANSNTQQEAA